MLAAAEKPIDGIRAGVATMAPRGAAVRRLALSEFRNHASTRLDVDSPAVVLTGANGSGKTNLLEAVSFLAPGRGLRRARLSEVDRIGGTGAGWAVSARIDGPAGAVSLGTGRDPAGDGEADRRVVRIDGVPARGQAPLAEHVRLTWLTPQMDRLFVEGSSNRRRFLDRLVYTFDPEHAARVTAFTHALRERGKLVREGRRDPAWFRALEETLAATAVAITAARRDLIARLAGPMAEPSGPFPAAAAALACPVSTMLDDMPALAAEERLKEALAAARRSTDGEPALVPGPHRADLAVRHLPKDMPAASCSTGEQKALLIGLVLAHARLGAAESGQVPLLLLDEIAAHLDSARRAALFDILLGLGGQVWMSGTDRALFAPLDGAAAFYVVADGTVAPA